MPPTHRDEPEHQLSTGTIRGEAVTRIAAAAGVQSDAQHQQRADDLDGHGDGQPEQQHEDR